MHFAQTYPTILSTGHGLAQQLFGHNRNELTHCLFSIGTLFALNNGKPIWNHGGEPLIVKFQIHSGHPLEINIAINKIDSILLFSISRTVRVVKAAKYWAKKRKTPSKHKFSVYVWVPTGLEINGCAIHLK